MFTALRRSVAAGLALVLTCEAAFAAEPEVMDSAQNSRPHEAAEAARQAVLSTTEWLARGVDGLFGDKPFSEGGKVTDGRLSLALQSRQHQAPDWSLRFNARFRLPNVERIGYLFVGSDDRRDTVADPPQAFAREQRLISPGGADRTPFAGLGLWWRESVDFRLGLRGGLKPYAQARYRRPFILGDADRIEFRETVFWASDDRLGSTTTVSYDHAWFPAMGLRWLNSATVTQRMPKAEWWSSLGPHWSPGPERLLTVEAVARGMQGSDVAVADYGLQAGWQEPVHQNWLLGDIIVGRFWHRDDMSRPRESSWASACASQ